jgi:[ribosomal protein S18]-alanine N-acetyltransferase
MSTVPLDMHYEFRRLDYADLTRVMEIEQAAYPFPWTLAIFQDCLRVGYTANALVRDQQILGYSMLTHAADEAHLLNLCIDPHWQGQGLGHLLLEHAIQWAQQMGVDSLFLEVRPSNKTGISLYRKHGFRVVGERPDYYRAEKGRENALIMKYDLPGPFGPRSPDWSEQLPF